MARLPEKEPPAVPIKLLMANLPIMLSDLLHAAFATVPDIQVMEPTNDIQRMSANSQNGPVDVIILGSLWEENISGAAAILESLRDRHEAARVVVLTQKPDYAETISLFRAGAKGILSSADLRFELLCKCIRCVYKGQTWANNEVLGHLVASLSRPKSTDVTDSCGRRLLTTREQQVLHLLAEGLSNSQLAEALKLSEHTIKNHLFRIYDKLGVSNRMEAVLYALTPRNTQPVESPQRSAVHTLSV